MRGRTWAVFIVVNIVVSAMVMLTILFVWERIRGPSTPTPIPASTLLATEDVSTPPTMPPAPSPSPPEQVLYTVQAGDTLGAIAQAYDVPIEDLMSANGINDANLLQVGQILVIPLGSPTIPTTGPSTETTPESSPIESLPTPLPTLTASGPPIIEIAQVLRPGDLAGEVVVIRNLGGMANLEGWTLSDAEGNAFTFPTITLFGDAQMRVHSTPGRSTPSDLYWGQEMPAWNSGELITLRDGAGSVVDTYIVP
jgi:LysM repeat protein